MNESQVREYIIRTFDGVDVVDAAGSSYFFYDNPDHMHPFTTLVTNDEHDQASNLSRPSVFRLNIGVSKQTFQSLFRSSSAPAGEGGAEGSYDFTEMDRIMPHPVYGKMYWVCVLNPGAVTLESVQKLLAEAYGTAVLKRAKTNRADDA
jgi:Family of unknown function (DUF6194)